MALTIRILAGGEPFAIAPVEMYFNGAHRVEDFTNQDGEIVVDPCPWANVHVTVAGVAYGVHTCYDGGEVEVETRPEEMADE